MARENLKSARKAAGMTPPVKGARKGLFSDLVNILLVMLTGNSLKFLIGDNSDDAFSVTVQAIVVLGQFHCLVRYGWGF